ncbi:MAG: WD40/YVTN/BNR-like repeat-containing protein [Terriglobales bacterium]
MAGWVRTAGVLVWLAAAVWAQTAGIVTHWQAAGPAQLVQAGSGLALASPLRALAEMQGAGGAPLLLAGGDGGLWSFAPQSAAWAPTSLAQPVTALAVSVDTILAGTASGLESSSDGGASWTAAGAQALSGLAIHALAVDPGNGDHVWALTSSGVFASLDGGTSWALQLPGNFTSLAGWGSALLLATPTDIELYNTGSGSVTSVAGLPPGWTSAAVAPGITGGFVLLLTEAGGALALFSVSGTAAASNLLSLPAGSPAGPHALLAAPQVGYWIAADNGLWLASTGGNVTSMNVGLANAAPLAFSWRGAQVIAALDGGGIAAGAASAGATWQAEAPAELLTALAPDPKQADSFYGVAEGELVHSTDDGATWQAAAAPAGLQGAAASLASSASGLWIGTQQGQIVAPDGDQQVDSGAIAALAACDGFAWAASGVALLRSNNGGASWTAMGNAAGAVSALAVDAANPELLAASVPEGVQVSADGGATWSAPVSLPVDAPITALSFDASQNLWAATLGRGLWTASLNTPAASLGFSPVSSAEAGTSIQLQATVMAMGAPAAGASVTFAASMGGEQVWTAAATSDAQGMASAAFTPPRAGAATLLAAALGVQASTELTVAPGPAAVLRLISGANQTQVAGSLLAGPIVLEVDDSYGDPVSGVVLQLGGAAFTNSAPVTGNDGRVSVSAQLPATAGAATLTATAAGVAPLSWQETAYAAGDFTLELTPPSAPLAPGQTGHLTLTVVPQYGFALPVALSCTQPLTGCTVSPSSVLPGQTASVVVSPAANQASLQVAVAGEEGGVIHQQSASLALQAFTLSAPQSALSVETGSSSVAIPLAVTALNGLSGNVSFQAALASGGALPGGLTPVFQPAIAALGGTGSAQVSFAITASASGSGAAGGLPWDGLTLALGLALAVGVRRRLRRSCGVLAICMCLAACGSRAAPPPAAAPAVSSATYNLLVTATLQGLQASVPLTLTVTTP